jgi:hypothetical protein
MDATIAYALGDTSSQFAIFPRLHHLCSYGLDHCMIASQTVTGADLVFHYHIYIEASIGKSRINAEFEYPAYDFV